ncbi:iron-sulfur cluster carrier protein [Cellvibrio zantedeschiae]|uniref:Iron-sulfur cluster carrier protein n=1 Tax=Cellvibrio zantedeschiae TaxID=1237077 RepID=A0ABQ3AVA4_9GAMM|nr:iron-sulfur cluster carrier protein ApbC [Cellvibrio zantedeschiae]GGY68990.1 iron-sulfur cluster carrier protein [Cellvibrio zantedeschiae]
MSVITPASVEQALQQVIDPTTGRDLTSLNAVTDIAINGSKVDVTLLLGYPANSVHSAIAVAVNEALNRIGVAQVGLDIGWTVYANPTANSQQALPEVKNIIAVASGKGGVGKSTTTANLALALAAEGARVAVLDADIYGPSQPQMLGAPERPPQVIKHNDQQFMVPVETHGIQVNSMGFMVTENTPMMWRGPMVSGALQQLLAQTYWQDVDYLLIDMPPGTGDIQITLAQKVPVTGAVIVTTPQDIALLDAKKGIEMFRKVNVPVLGVVENMAIHICSNCGHEEHIFGEGGGERIARDYDTELLGSLPLNLSIREDADNGKPSVATDPESAVSKIYRDVARKLSAKLWVQNLDSQAMPDIEITED